MPTLSFHQLRKQYGPVTVLDGFTATALPGRVTAFLGVNGAGKTTSMRIMLGLTEPTSGTATVDGVRYADLPHPTRVIGSVLDQGFHPNRTARNHLMLSAMQARVPVSRAEDLLDRFGLERVGDRRVGGFSLGMRQRLALASALVGDPSVLILDEPLNGLDPDGIREMRGFVRSFADAGGTVFLSSHLLGEVAAVADDLVVLHRGTLAAAGPVKDLVPDDTDLESVFHSLIHPSDAQEVAS